MCCPFPEFIVGVRLEKQSLAHLKYDTCIFHEAPAEILPPAASPEGLEQRGYGRLPGEGIDLRFSANNRKLRIEFPNR